MDKMREALERALEYHDDDHTVCCGIHYGLSCDCWPGLAREAIAELDKPEESDARELARKVYDNYGHNDNNAAELIESFVSARERKTSEETARKCADAAVNLIYANTECQDAEMLKISILEAAK